MANIDFQYTVEALSINDKVLVVNVENDPSTGAGFEAPVGSFAVRSDVPKIYQKVGGADTAWTEIQRNTIIQDLAANKPAAGVANRIYIATDTKELFRDNGTSWDIFGDGTGTVKSVSTVQPSAGLTISGGPVTTIGTLTFALANDLAALESLSGTGFAKRTGSDTWVLDTNTYITGNQTITLSGDISGSGTTSINTTLATVNVNVGTFGSGTTVPAITVNGKGLVTGVTTTNITFPVTSVFGRTGNIIAVDGDYSLNLLGDVVLTTPTNGQILRYNGTNWVNGIDYTGTVTSITATAPAAGLTISGSPITTSGTLTFALANDLAGLENLATNGIAIRTGTSTWTTRSLAAGTYITLTNADGIAGNPTINVNLTSGNLISILGYTPENAANKGIPGGYASLDSNGWLTASQIPPIAITDTYVVANQTAMLALTAQMGDVAVRTDLSKSFILKGTDPTILANWQELLNPTSPVTSVNGQTGTVVINDITGNAGTATALQTSRNITLTSDVTGTATFNGTADASITTTLSNTGVTAGTYTKITVDAKGRATSATNLLASDLPSHNQAWSTITGTPTTLAGYGITNAVINASGAVSIQEDTTANRPTAGTAGRLFVDTSARILYRDNGTTWDQIGASGTVTSISASAPSAGLTITGSPITSSGTLTFALANDLAAIEAVNGTGFYVRTGTDTWAARTLSGTAGTISVSNGAGTAGNPVITLANAGTAGTYVSVTTDIYGRVTSGSTTQAWSTITGTPTTLAGYGITNGVSSVAASSSSSGLSITGSPITSSGTLSFSLGAPLQGLYSLYSAIGSLGNPYWSGAGWVHASASSGNRIYISDGTSINFSSVIPSGLLFSASSSTTPVITLQTGTVLTSPAVGAVEWNGNRLFLTSGSPTTRNTVAYLSDLTLDGLSDVIITSPVAGQTLSYNGTSWINSAMSSITDLPAIQCRRTTNLTIGTTFTDIPLEAVDLANDTTYLERDGTNTDRILVKQTGLYLILSDISWDAPTGSTPNFEFRVIVNDTNVVPASNRQVSEDDEVQDISDSTIVLLNAGDFVTFQARCDTAGTPILATSSFGMIRMGTIPGTPGAQGPAGSGSNITVKEEGTNVPNSPHTSLNFIGPGVTVTDAGGGVANITVESMSAIDLPVTHVRTTASFNTQLTYQDVSFNVADIQNQTGTIEWVSGSSITVKETGLYLISFFVNDTYTTSHQLNIRLRKNSSTVIDGTSGIYSDSGVQDWFSNNHPVLLTANDTIQLQISANATFSIPAGITLSVIRLKGVKGEQGPTGSGSSIQIYDEGVIVSGGPFTSIDFVGPSVTTTNPSGAQAQVNILGNVTQVLSAAIPAATANTLIPLDNTAPTNTEGTQIWTTSFTPTSSTSKINICMNIIVESGTNARRFVAAFFDGATCIGVAETYAATLNVPYNLNANIYYVPGTTATRNISCRFGIAGATATTWYVNREATAYFAGLLANNGYTITEFL